MRQIVAPIVVVALLIAPSIGDLLARRGDVCALAPCCIGKMSKSCPMHSSSRGKGMRACGNDDLVAVAHQVVAVLEVRLDEATPAAQPLAPRSLEPPSYFETTPPDPPPPRLS